MCILKYNNKGYTQQLITELVLRIRLQILLLLKMFFPCKEKCSIQDNKSFTKCYIQKLEQVDIWL